MCVAIIVNRDGHDSLISCVVQPLSKSINHIAAGATAVGLTFAFGATGVSALLLGICLLVIFTYAFHKLL